MDKLKNNGVYFALLTAVISGFSVFINKFAVGFIKHPLTFTATKNLFVGVIILFILLLSKKGNKIFDVNRNDLWKLLTISIVGGAIPFYLFFTGISTIPAINAALIHKTLFVWVALLAVPILKEKVTKLQMAGIATLFASNLVVGGFKGFTFSTGEIMVLAATILWSVENIIAKKVLINIDPDVLTFYRMGVGSIFLVIASLITAPQSVMQVFSLSVEGYIWFTATAIALFGYVITWYKALKLAPAITVTSVLVAATLITNILSAIFITHSLNKEIFLQIPLVVLGVVMFYIAERKEASLPSTQVL